MKSSHFKNLFFVFTVVVLFCICSQSDNHKMCGTAIPYNKRILKHNLLNTHNNQKKKKHSQVRFSTF